MKKKFYIILSILATISLVVFFLPAKIDYGSSDIYSLEDRKAAADIIVNKISSFEGCRLLAVKYDGDAVSVKNLNYCKELAEEGINFVDSIVFTSYFRSPVFGGGAWNANEIYSWSWYLARTSDGDWELLTYGYA